MSNDFPLHVLSDYALLADGERGILVGPRGDFAWMCFPHWDSGAIFSSLIGGQGTYAVTPSSRYVWGGYYEPGSLIWHSRWVTADATIECREALAIPSSPARADASAIPEPIRPQPTTPTFWIPTDALLFSAAIDEAGCQGTS